MPRDAPPLAFSLTTSPRLRFHQHLGLADVAAEQTQHMACQDCRPQLSQFSHLRLHEGELVNVSKDIYHYAIHHAAVDNGVLEDCLQV